MPRAAPLVSFVIPTHNRRVLVGEAVRSALAQDLEDLEVVVVDDGSTDGTPSFLQELFPGEDRLRVVLQDPSGPASARNRGVTEARGRYILFLDSDDLAAPGRATAQVAAMEADPAIAFTVGDATLASGRGTVFGLAGYRPPLSLEAMFGGAWATPSVLALRAEVARAVPFDVSFPCQEDTDLLFTLHREGHRAALVDRVVGTYVDDAAVGSGDRLSDQAQRMRVHHDRMLAKHWLALAPDERRRLRVAPLIHRRLSRWHLARGERRQARSHILASWRQRPLRVRHALRWLQAFRANGSAGS
jgi:glycosyltransferase involved in cell wall biosynthesis